MNIFLLAGFTGGMYLISGFSAFAASLYVAYIWNKAKIRSHTGNDGRIRVTIPNGARGRTDMHYMSKGLDHVKKETGETGHISRVRETKTKIYKKTRSQRRQEKKNKKK